MPSARGEPLVTTRPHPTTQAVVCCSSGGCDDFARAACEQQSGCVAFGVYNTVQYELYFNMAQISSPLPDKGWDYWYKFPPIPPPQFTATQELGAARVNTSLGFGDFFVNTSTIIHPDANLLLGSITVSEAANVTFTLQTPNMYGLPTNVGSDGSALWMHRQANKWVHNDAVLSDCDMNSLNWANTRLFTIAAGGEIGPLRNASASANDTQMCMHLGTDAMETQPHQTRGSFITMAPCGQNGTRWLFNALTGKITSLDAPNTCVAYWGGRYSRVPLQQIVRPMPCTTPMNSNWSLTFSVTNADALGGYLEATNADTAIVDAGTPKTEQPCLAIVRDNINISLDVGLVVTDSTNQVVHLSSTSKNGQGRANCDFPQGRAETSTGCNDTYAVTGTFLAKAGVEYTMRVAMFSTRGSETENTPSASNAAASADPNTVRTQHARVWDQFWNASSIDLGDNHTELEGFWYGAQYMLRCMSKGFGGGGVIPGLLGPWSLQDPVGWSDDVTLDCECQPASQVETIASQFSHVLFSLPHRR